MALDPRYILAPSLQMYFVDKDTGQPLAGGKVYFFIDNTNIPKDVFELSGNAPDFTYTVLPNPVILSAVGTFQDGSGADILPYYFPFDASGNIELYTIQVYDSNGVLQFTRSGWPNFTSSSVTPTLNITNYVPNGQFLLHDNIPASSANGYVAGKLSQDSTVIAPGGWSFERGPASTATDIITFPRYNAYIDSPSGNPRYALQYQCSVAGSDNIKYIALKFPNVNTFAGDQDYNFYFEAQSLTGNDITNVQILVRKYFGSGTSSGFVTSSPFNIFTISSSIGNFNTTINFGPNQGYVLGPNNDDYVQVIISLPPTTTTKILITDVALTPSSDVLAAFPQQSEAQQIDPSTAGWFPVPDPNGNDLYCPAILGPSGLLFDHSSIGQIVGLMVNNGNQTGNLLFCDGSAYLTSDYSSLGIPYSRLQQVLFNSSQNGPLFGTGVNFVLANLSTGNTSKILLTTNKVGSQTNPADGATVTGFTFNAVVNSGASTIGYNAYANQVANVIAVGTSVGSVTLGISAGTSGMGVSDLKQTGQAAAYYAFSLTALTAAALSAGGGIAGLYFDFSSTSVNYRMWFQVNGEIAPAAGGRTLIQCNLPPSASAVDVALIISQRISSHQLNTIDIPGQPTNAGGYFTFNANGTTYYVWYKINGVGTAPAQPFAQLIEVDLTGAENSAQVTTKTITAINSHFFAVPDLRGQFLRGNDPSGTIDVNAGIRYGYFANTLSYLGTYQVDQFSQHQHQLGNTATGGAGSVGSTGSGQFTDHAGGFETRPENVAINYFIRY